MADIFVSCAKNDEEIAEKLRAELEAAGYSTWYYKYNNLPGINYVVQITEAIANSEVFLLIISPDSINSHQVNKEVTNAHEANKPFIPVLYKLSEESLQQNKPDWKFAFNASHTIELPLPDIKEAIPQITSGITRLLNRAAEINVSRKNDETKIGSEAVGSKDLNLAQSFVDTRAQSVETGRDKRVSVWVALWVLWIIANFFAFNWTYTLFGVLYGNLSPLWILLISGSVKRFIPSPPFVSIFLGTMANSIFSAWLGYQLGGGFGLVFGILFGSAAGLVVSIGLNRKDEQIKLLFLILIIFAFTVSTGICWLVLWSYQIDLWNAANGLQGSIWALLLGGILIFAFNRDRQKTVE